MIAAWLILGFGAWAQVGREEVAEDARRLSAALAPQFARLEIGVARDLVAACAAGAGVRITLVDGQGAVVADSDVAASVSLKNLRDRPEIRDALSNGTGFERREAGTPPRDLVFAASRVPGADLVLRVARDPTAFEATAGGVVRTFALWSALCLLLGFAGAVVLARNLARPLSRLLDATQAVRAGHLDARVGGAGEDEIGRLLSGFNAMTEQLETAVQGARDETRRLDAVLQGMSEGVIALDAGERVTFFNGAARSILGVPGDQDVKGVRLYEIVRDPRTLAIVQAARGSWRGVSAEVIHEGPPRRTLQLQATPLGGESSDLILVVRDLSPLRRLERMRSDFVSNVSHELRTPLASISVAVETLEDPEVRRNDEVGGHFLSMIARNIARLDALLSDILALSSLESQPEVLPKVPCDFSALCRTATEDLKERARAGGLTLSFEAPSRVVVDGDGQALRRIVDNLVMNAITYTPSGGRVGVRVELEGDSALLKVRDTGIGIPEEDRDRIFERFYRVDKARSRSAGGTGLGLAIVKHAAKLHGGDVTVESRVGKGSTFTVRLPGARTETAPTGAAGAGT